MASLPNLTLNPTTLDMYYSVYGIASLGAPRDHHGIFAETNTIDGGGITTHVTGNIRTEWYDIRTKDGDTPRARPQLRQQVATW